MPTERTTMRARRLPSCREVLRWTPLAKVGGSSMAPTLTSGELVVTRPAWRRVKAGDVVLLRHSARDGDPRLMVKRVAGTAGDVVALQAGRLCVNGTPWSRACRPGAVRQTWTVPDGHVFVVGDNEAGSTDSRVWADPFVPVRTLDGVVIHPGHGRAARAARTDAARGRGEV